LLAVDFGYLGVCIAQVPTLIRVDRCTAFESRILARLSVVDIDIEERQADAILEGIDSQLTLCKRSRESEEGFEQIEGEMPIKKSVN
jgi:hypothetical protein